ncbi:MAG: S26 family signal peptidase, partial [Patescibacteria group bacterium]
GEFIEEDYLPDSLQSRDNLSTKIKADEYFVGGDNRSHSFDSRNWGPVNRDKIIGVARLRVFPFNKLEYFQYAQEQ